MKKYTFVFISWIKCGRISLTQLCKFYFLSPSLFCIVFFSSSGSLILDAQIVSTKAKLALSSFLLLTILPSYFSTFLVSLHNHLYHISIVLSPTPLPPPHLYCFPMLLYHHHICIVLPLATTTTTFVLFSHPPLQPPYLYRFPIHHICIVVQSTLTTFLLFARNRQSPILIKYGQPLFVWLSRDWPSARTYASTDCKGGVGKTIKREGGVSWQVHILYIGHLQNGQLTAVKTG